MKARVAALLCGALFAIGLCLAGMTQPQKVLGFLDVSGRWDPSLACVMCAAIPVFTVAYRFARRRGAPLLDREFHLPQPTAIDRQLAFGATLFGIGWGLSGYCPGPAIASLVSPSLSTLAFVLAMLAGFAAHAAMVRARAPASGSPAERVTTA